MMIAADQGLRLELMNQPVSAGEMPIRIELVPHSVEPNSPDLSIIRQQLSQLPVHKIQVSIPIPGIRAARTMSRSPARKIIGRMPIELGVVQEQLDALFMALLGEHPDYVLAVRRARHDIPIRQFRIEHREPVVMLRGNGDVFHACGLCQRDPRRGIIFDGIEKRRQLRVIRPVDGARLHDPFAVAQYAIYAPVDEHAKLRILEPRACLQIRCNRRVILLRGCAWSRCDGSCE